MTSNFYNKRNTVVVSGVSSFLFASHHAKGNTTTCRQQQHAKERSEGTGGELPSWLPLERYYANIF